METDEAKAGPATNGVVEEVVAGAGEKVEKMFTLKKWNAVAMWSWDVECDTCAICRVQVATVDNICLKLLPISYWVEFKNVIITISWWNFFCRLEASNRVNLNIFIP